MAIQVRRGNEVDFDPNKMLPGEWAVSLDTKYVRMCFSPGVCLRMATYEGFEADMAQIQQILSEVRTAEAAIKKIQSEVNAQAEIVDENTDLCEEYARRAENAADKAEAVTDIHYATKDRAGIVAPQDIHVDEQGNMVMIAETTDSTLQNSHAGGIVINEVLGADEQETTSGKQLVESRLESATSSGITLTRLGNGWYQLEGTATANATFRIDQSTISGNDNLNPYHGDYTLSSEWDGTMSGASCSIMQNGTWAIPMGVTVSNPTQSKTLAHDNCFVVLMVNSGSTVSGKVRPMLNVGSTAKPWEPYTGGIASPNPAYQQSIDSVVVKEIKAHGRNYFNNPIKDFSGNGVTTTIANQVITLNGTATADVRCPNTAFKVNGTGKKAKLVVLSGSYKGNITLYLWNARYVGNELKPDVAISLYDMEYSILALVVKDGAVCNNLKLGIIISENVDTWEPWQEPSAITLSNPITLHSKDRIVKQDGVWGVERNTIEFLYNGTEAWELSATTRKIFRHYETAIKAPVNNYDVANFMNNLAPCVEYYDDGTGNDEIFGVSDGVAIDRASGIYVRLNSIAEITDLATFKAWLATNNLQIVAELATPTFEPLPTADQIALNSLKSFDGVTHVETDSEVKPTIHSKYGTSKVGAMALELQNENANLKLQLSNLKPVEITETKYSIPAKQTTDTAEGIWMAELTRPTDDDYTLLGWTIVNPKQSNVDFYVTRVSEYTLSGNIVKIGAHSAFSVTIRAMWAKA